MIEAVVDSSAILAVLFAEPGGERVAPLLGRATISSVNAAEVLGKLIELSAPHEAHRRFSNLTLTITDFDEGLALATAALRPGTRALGLSLGDRACLATALQAGLPVLTADRLWATLDVGVEVVLIR